MSKKVTADSAKPMFDLDRRARKALLPYRDAPPVKAIDWLSAAGDQTQMRVFCGATLVLGLLRRDLRMVGAAAKMLAAHEAATWAKNQVKDRVVRERPRSLTKADGHKPRKGKDKRKEKSSFPSGHAAGAFAVAGALGAEYPGRALAAHGAASVIALGRIPRCAHYPSDVVAGAAVGAVVGGTVNLAWALARRVLAVSFRRGSSA